MMCNDPEQFPRLRSPRCVYHSLKVAVSTFTKQNEFECFHFHHFPPSESLCEWGWKWEADGVSIFSLYCSTLLFDVKSLIMPFFMLLWFNLRTFGFITL